MRRYEALKPQFDVIHPPLMASSFHFRNYIDLLHIASGFSPAPSHQHPLTSTLSPAPSHQHPLSGHLNLTLILLTQLHHLTPSIQPFPILGGLIFPSSTLILTLTLLAICNKKEILLVREYLCKVSWVKQGGRKSAFSNTSHYRSWVFTYLRSEGKVSDLYSDMSVE
jgi:hypothetical protein